MTAAIKWKWNHTIDFYITTGPPPKWTYLDGIQEKYRFRHGNCLLFTEENNTRVLFSSIQIDDFNLTTHAIYECQWVSQQMEYYGT